MAINHYVSIEAEHVGFQIANDPRDAADLLLMLADCASEDFGEELAESMAPEHHAPLAQFLRHLADQLDAEVAP